MVTGPRRREEDDMAAARKPVWRVEVGDEAPDFELMATGNTAGKGDTRKTIKLSDYRGKKNVVLAFYPAAYTPV
jgi:peroxiredoxin